MMSSLRNRTGSILMVSLWMLIILSILVLGIGYRLTTRMRLVNYQMDELHLQGLVNAGIQLALVKLNEDKNQVDLLVEPWANCPEVFRQHMFDDGCISIDYTKLDPDSGRLSAVYGLIDEERKININTASLEVLARMPGISASSAHAIVDYRARKKTFELLDELLLLGNISPENLSQFRDLVTVYGSGRVNINTAPSGVLKALGMSDMLVDSIISYRAGVDGKEGTTDDRYFSSEGRITEELAKCKALSAEANSQISLLNKNALITVASTHFTVPLEITLNTGIRRTATAVIDKNLNRIEYWRENS